MGLLLAWVWGFWFVWEFAGSVRSFLLFLWGERWERKADARGRGYQVGQGLRRGDIAGSGRWREHRTPEGEDITPPPQQPEPISSPSGWHFQPVGKKIRPLQGTEADAGRPVLEIELGLWDEISKNPKNLNFMVDKHNSQCYYNWAVANNCFWKTNNKKEFQKNEIRSWQKTEDMIKYPSRQQNDNKILTQKCLKKTWKKYLTNKKRWDKINELPERQNEKPW